MSTDPPRILDGPLFVAVVHFPPVPAERDSEFRRWFAWSNDQLGDSVGLVGRRLLRTSDGAYVGLIEHESAATFAQMHASPSALAVQQHLHGMLEGQPRADVYEAVDGADDERATISTSPTTALHRPNSESGTGTHASE